MDGRVRGLLAIAVCQLWQIIRGIERLRLRCLELGKELEAR